MRTYEEVVRHLAQEHTLRARQSEQFDYTADAHKEAISADFNLTTFVYGKTYGELRRDIENEQAKHKPLF